MLLHYLTEVGRCLAQQFFFLLLTFGLHLAMCPQITCRFSSLCKIDIAKYQKLRFRKMTLSHPQEMLTGCWHAPHMQVTADHDHQIYYYSCTFLSEPSILFFFFLSCQMKLIRDYNILHQEYFTSDRRDIQKLLPGWTNFWHEVFSLPIRKGSHGGLFSTKQALPQTRQRSTDLTVWAVISQVNR